MKVNRGEIKCAPSWGPESRRNRNNPDILIDAIQLEYDYEGNVINESKEDNITEVKRNLKVINTLLSLVSWDGLCSIWVDYNPEDEEYEIRSKTTESYFDDNNIEQELESLEDSISSMGIRVYIYTPWYVENCEDEVKFMNESKETEPKYLSLIKELVEPFKDEEGVCDINVSYNDEDNMYTAYLVIGTEEMNEKFIYVPAMNNHISKLRMNVKNTIKQYIPIDNLYVGSYGTPYCGWNPLNENWYKVPSSEFGPLERIINLEMREKYGWWKDIKINTLNYITMYEDVQIEAELTVDEEWGANQWRDFYYSTKFPGNEGWEDDNGYSRRVSLGDITDSTYAEVIRDDLREILKYTLNIDTHNMSFRNVYLIFE
jgi:hypothetical protein